MTSLAIEGIPGFAVSLVDAPKPAAAPNYTLDTLLDLRATLPAGGTLFCLMGADSFFGLKRWHRSAEIPFVAPLIVASRPGQPLDDLRAALPPGLTLGADPRCHPAPQIAGEGAVVVQAFQLRNPAGGPRLSSCSQGSISKSVRRRFATSSGAGSGTGSERRLRARLTRAFPGNSFFPAQS